MVPPYAPRASPYTRLNSTEIMLVYDAFATVVRPRTVLVPRALECDARCDSQCLDSQAAWLEPSITQLLIYTHKVFRRAGAATGKITRATDHLDRNSSLSPASFKARVLVPPP